MKRVVRNIVKGDRMPSWFENVFQRLSYNGKRVKRITKITMEFELEK